MKPIPIAAEPVSAYDAKTHLPRLLERAAQGERFVITRHGKPVAQLIPFEAADDEALAQLLDRVDRMRNRLARRNVRLADILTPEERARDLAHSGHRY